MKLHNWAIADALSSRDWQAAIDAACDLFGLARFHPESAIITGVVIQECSRYPEHKIPPQIKICYEGTAYSWAGNRSNTWYSPLDCIYIWVPTMQ
jgi:hypothetical protein